MLLNIALRGANNKTGSALISLNATDNHLKQETQCYYLKFKGLKLARHLSRMRMMLVSYLLKS